MAGMIARIINNEGDQLGEDLRRRSRNFIPSEAIRSSSRCVRSPGTRIYISNSSRTKRAGKISFYRAFYSVTKCIRHSLSFSVLSAEHGRIAGWATNASKPNRKFRPRWRDTAEREKGSARAQVGERRTVSEILSRTL